MIEIGTVLSMQKNDSPNKKTHTLYAYAYIALIIGAILIIALHQILTYHIPSPPQSISELVSNPATWENQEVRVQGIIQEISVGIIQPFNSWLSDPKNQTIRIGVKTPMNDYPKGNWVEVTGIVRKGYAYVQPDYPGEWVYFINASSIICP